MQTEAAIHRTAPIALWRVAEAFLHVLYNLFGAPEDVAFQHTLTRKPYRLLLSWLRVGEALLRRLLTIEAAAYPKPNTPPRLWPTRERKRRLLGFDADKPEAWRVSFRCFMERRRPRRRSPSQRESALKTNHTAGETPALHNFHSAWPLAERYEALIRVFNDPQPYARRLSARLHARPHLIAAVLAATPDYENRVDHAETITRTAERAWPHNTS